MENFFYNDKFYMDLSALMDDLDISNPKELENDWSAEIEESVTEPLVQLSARNIEEMIFNNYEERYSEDAPESDTIIKALNACINFETLNKMIPELHYPSRSKVAITKVDLIEYCA